MADESLRRLSADEVAASAAALGALFVDAVDAGASIGYMAGLAQAEAEDYWRGVARELQGRRVTVAEDAAGIAGVVILAPFQAAFQPHRAEIVKLVVHRRARGRGLAAALMRAAEDDARALGRTVLTLMTRRGSEGEHLYRKLGWTLAGVIEEDSLAPDGASADAAIYRKRIAP